MTWGSFKSPEDDWDQEITIESECSQEFNGYLISDELLSLLTGSSTFQHKWVQFARNNCYAEDIDCPFEGEVTATLYGNAKTYGEILWDCPVCGKENSEDPERFFD